MKLSNEILINIWNETIWSGKKVWKIDLEIFERLIGRWNGIEFKLLIMTKCEILNMDQGEWEVNRK